MTEQEDHGSAPHASVGSTVFTMGESRKQRFAIAFIGNAHETIA